MPAIVRVKRRIGEEPLNAFILNGKRRRLEDIGHSKADEKLHTPNKDEISTILKFAGTINEQDDSATTQLVRLNKVTAKELVQQKTRQSGANPTERARQAMRQSLREQRFRVVNCLRTTLESPAKDEDDDDNNPSAKNSNSDKQITIVDIEKQNAVPNDISVSTEITRNSILQPSDSDTGYVYDLYLPENEQQAADVDLMDDNYLSVRAFDNLIYEDRYNNSDDEDNDSEDSNQENYFTNDYPDEEDKAADNSESDEYEDVRELRQDLRKFIMDDDDDDEEVEAEYDTPSSDDDDDYDRFQDPYVHSVSVAETNFTDDVDYCDVDRFGMAYARYKARVLKKLQNEQVDTADNVEKDKSENSDLSEERYHSASEKENFD